MDNISWGEYLRGFIPNSPSWTGYNPLLPNQRISPAETLKWADLDLIRFEFGAADLRASLLEFVRDDETIGAKGKDQIAGGMDRLPTGFIDPLRAWGKWEWDLHRTEARNLGATVELHYLSAPLDELFRRIQLRIMEMPPIRWEAF